MNNTLSYKGFSARIEFSADDNVFFGRVIGIDDIVTFHAETVGELNSEMKETVDFYLEVCKKKGKPVKKTFNGKVLFRFPSELHASIAIAEKYIARPTRSRQTRLFAKMRRVA